MRIVVKVGTRVLIGTKGLDPKKVSRLMGEIAKVMKKGYEVILVSSGAIGTGLPYVHFSNPARKKIAASVGQPLLMHRYIEEAKKHKISVGQILILSEDFANKEHFKNFIRNINAMLLNKVLPIINENDFMKTGDLTIGDNDMFGAVVAHGIRANKYIMLTNQDGLFTCNPDHDKGAKLIKEVIKINEKVEKLCSDGIADISRGGMTSKIQAAKYATKKGIETFIGRGDENGMLLKALSKNFPGTRFSSNKKNNKK